MGTSLQCLPPITPHTYTVIHMLFLFVVLLTKSNSTCLKSVLSHLPPSISQYLCHFCCNHHYFPNHLGLWFIYYESSFVLLSHLPFIPDPCHILSVSNVRQQRSPYCLAFSDLSYPLCLILVGFTYYHSGVFYIINTSWLEFYILYNIFELKTILWTKQFYLIRALVEEVGKILSSYITLEKLSCLSVLPFFNV